MLHVKHFKFEFMLYETGSVSIGFSVTKFFTKIQIYIYAFEIV